MAWSSPLSLTKIGRGEEFLPPGSGAPFVITRHEPPMCQDFHTTGGPVRPDGILRCVDEGGATRVSYELTLHGPFAKLMAVGLRRGMPGNLANVKKILEERS